MKEIVLYVMNHDGNYMVEVTGNIYGRIVGNSIYDICRKFSKSNAARLAGCTIYIDERGSGKRVAEELEHTFKIKTVKAKSRKLYVPA